MRCGESSVPGGCGQSVGSFARPSSRRAVPLPNSSAGNRPFPAFRVRHSPCSVARQTSRAPVGTEDTAMTEDLLLTAGVLIASAICGWYVVHAISGVVLSIPVDDSCTMAAQCLALAGG